MAVKDHQVDAKNRVITQYKDATSTKKYLDAALVLANELEQVFCDLLLKRFIDTAEGVVLDNIGELVGQPRILVAATATDFFGFDGEPDALGFTDLLAPETGGRFRALGEATTGNIPLVDEDYRLFIRARIIKNDTRATREDIISMIVFVLGASGVEVIEGNRNYRVDIGLLLTDIQRALILTTDLLPKPQGIGVGYAFFDPDLDAFTLGDIGDLDAEKGFSSLADPSSGGQFSTLV